MEYLTIEEARKLLEIPVKIKFRTNSKDIVDEIIAEYNRKPEITS